MFYNQFILSLTPLRCFAQDGLHVNTSSLGQWFIRHAGSKCRLLGYTWYSDSVG